MENESDPLAQFGLDAIDLRWTLKDIASSFAKKGNVGDCSLRQSIGSVDHRTKMTGDDSRELEIGDRVCWGSDKNDQGTSERLGMKSSLIGTMARRLQHNDIGRRA